MASLEAEAQVYAQSLLKTQARAQVTLDRSVSNNPNRGIRREGW